MQSQGKPKPSPRASRPAEGMLCAMHALRDDQGLLRAVSEKHPSSFYTSHAFLQRCRYILFIIHERQQHKGNHPFLSQKPNSKRNSCFFFAHHRISQTFPSNEHLSRGQQMAIILQSSMGVESITAGWSSSQHCSEILKFLVRHSDEEDGVELQCW